LKEWIFSRREGARLSFFITGTLLGEGPGFPSEGKRIRRKNKGERRLR